MAYPAGQKEVVFLTTGGSPYLSCNATTGLVRMPTGAVDVRVRALAFIQTTTNIKAPAIRVYLASSNYSTSTGTVVDVITSVTTGAAGTYGRGSITFVDGLRTIVSAGSDLYARVPTAATKVWGKVVAYVDVEPFDLLNNARATESA